MWVHRLSSIDEERQVADCRGCGPAVPIKFERNKGRWACRAGRNRPGRRRMQDPSRTAESRRAEHLYAKFRMRPADYEALLSAQSGVCAICTRECSTGRRLAVDHDHSTGLIRGLLCLKCNRSIGLMEDDPDQLMRAANYLIAHDPAQRLPGAYR